jgi:Spy/CpxP family protein refolding chaperone
MESYMKKFWIITALVLTLGATFMLAQTARRMHEHGFFAGKMAQELNLTADQQTQINSIMQAERPKMQPLMQQLRSDEQQIREASKATPFDEAKVTSLANQEAQVRAQLTVERARVQSQIFQVLTPEQRSKAEAMHQKFGGRMHRHKKGTDSTTPQQ